MIVQFCFDVLVFVYLFCLFSNAKFYIFLTVHLGTIRVNNQLDALLSVLIFTSLRVPSFPVVSLIIFSVVPPEVDSTSESEYQGFLLG